MSAEADYVKGEIASADVSGWEALFAGAGIYLGMGGNVVSLLLDHISI
jgi:hypothetical protein